MWWQALAPGQAGLETGLWGTQPKLCGQGHSQVQGLAAVGVRLAQQQLCRTKAGLYGDLMSHHSDTATIPPTQHAGRGGHTASFPAPLQRLTLLISTTARKSHTVLSTRPALVELRLHTGASSEDPVYRQVHPISPLLHLLQRESLLSPSYTHCQLVLDHTGCSRDGAGCVMLHYLSELSQVPLHEFQSFCGL